MTKTTSSVEGIKRLLRDVFPGEEMQRDTYNNIPITDALKQAFLRLNFRQTFILIRRYQLDGGDKEHTLEELSEMVGRSKENARQHEAKALRKLRHPSTKLYKYVRRES